METSIQQKFVITITPTYKRNIIKIHKSNFKFNIILLKIKKNIQKWIYFSFHVLLEISIYVYVKRKYAIYNINMRELYLVTPFAI